MSDTQVLVVGAGPTGLVLALWLVHQGVRVRIIDRTAEPGTTSRALAVQARTLELYRQLDLSDAVIARGYRVPAARLWVGGEARATIAFGDVSQRYTAFPFMLEIFPQDEHERLLIERLAALGVVVERETELLDFTETSSGVRATLRHADGGEEQVDTAYLAGCDGARSRVREVLSGGFPGGTYRQLFYVADVQASGPAVNGDLNLDLDDVDFLAVFPLAHEGRVRLIGTVQDQRADHADQLSFDDVSRRAIDHLGLQVQQVNWFSTYHVHHRVAEHFRKGRSFLLGDAAHIHSPVGGQGMNTGIGDAINLAWKLAGALRGAPDSVLDTYETERIAFARKLVATTDRVFTAVNADGAMATMLRTRIAPMLLPALAQVSAWRDAAFRLVSQIDINNRNSPLSKGRAGDVHGGDRMPWVNVDGVDNHESLSAIRWQVQVYGEVSAEVAAWCSAHQIPLHHFAWTKQHGQAGIERDAAYLMRPDSYVALAGADREGLERYRGSWELGAGSW